MYCDKVTKILYSNQYDPVGLADPTQKHAIMRILAREYEELKETVKANLTGMIYLGFIDESPRSYSIVQMDILVESLSIWPDLADFSVINTLYMRAAGLHLRLSVFFDSPTTESYREDLLALWTATTEFLECALHLETSAGKITVFVTNYILQMIIAAGFTLLKLLNSFFASFVNLDYGKQLFTQTVSAIRNISVTNSDLPSRLAEVLAQLWRSAGVGSKLLSKTWDVDNSLQLKVRCRMSLSLVFDSVWRWREEFQAKGRGNLECKSACLKLLQDTLTCYSGSQESHEPRFGC